ncbi:hypothetical protein M409DRAFT_68539 [Zasmidium cellare ATCC 36951]|uniref:FAM86 N-terminal domain-containing protein n=1 Tax=Zasmidium cellare ATCC 36951 TaxID=1080233 RepID=A0A6A6CCQ0_ZASCE|nr:uncharacterized protein M409DRAFT_68539 [Zasmidium cellare ATCC 36951]KAF2163226.1 hypothetical protein M409DRAFT_68539 [Zasmidium cellare ATCC 36951]
MMDPQLVLFRRQYLQLFEPDFLAWPPKQLLRDADVQSWLHANLFNSDKNPRLPPERYQLRVLKPLVKKIEQSIEDPEEDEISDLLMTHLSTLITSTLPSESQAVQQKSHVTFVCLPPTSPQQNLHLPPSEEPTLTLLERPHLISGSLTTGFRTWEAALHLGSYLLTSPDLIRGKNVLELGAGTGFLSILAAKHLGAQHVTVTDGDEGVVEALKENFFFNGLDDEGGRVGASVLRWGRGFKGTWVEEEFEKWPVDLVVGADITYDKQAISALVATMRMLFELRPGVQVLIAGTVRNAETFGSFTSACERNHFEMTEIDFQPRPIREQTALFYAKAVPFKTFLIRGPPIERAN